MYKIQKSEHNFTRVNIGGGIYMKMSKDAAQSLAKRGIDHSEKMGIPLKKKKHPKK